MAADKLGLRLIFLSINGNYQAMQPSGGNQQHACCTAFVRIAQTLPGATGTAAALGSHAKVAAQILECLCTLTGSLVNLSLGHGMANANIHLRKLQRLK